MARGVNKVILLGNLGQDPEIRFLPSGAPVANFRIATSESWKDKNTGERMEKTEWHSIVAFNKLAEIIQQYVKKGSKVYIEGKLQTRKWQGQDGQDRYSTEIVANDMQMLDSRNGGGQQGGQQGGYGGGQQQGSGYGGGQQQGGQGGGYGGYGGQQDSGPRNDAPPANAPAPGSFDDFDDEIPF